MILSSDFCRVRIGRRTSSTESRAWVISPDGTPYDCGDNHLSCVVDGPLYDLIYTQEWGECEEDSAEEMAFVERWLLGNGWAKVGYFYYNCLAYIAVKGMGHGMFKAFKNILLGWDLDDNCQIEVRRPGRSVFYWEDFKNFDSLDDMKWFTENKGSSSYGWR